MSESKGISATVVVESETAATGGETTAAAVDNSYSVAAASLLPPIFSFSSPNESPSTGATAAATIAASTADRSHDLPDSYSCSGIVILEPRQSEQSQSSRDESKYMKLIEDFNTALFRASEAGRALHNCHKEEKQKQKLLDTCLLKEDDDLCPEEREQYKERCEEVMKYESYLKEAYENEYTRLKVCLKELEKQLQTSERDHKETVDKMAEKHDTEVKELTRKMSIQADLQKLQSEANATAKLKELKQRYQEQEEEVKSLRSKLAVKEQALFKLGEQIKACEKEDKFRQMITDRDHMKQQLRTCEQIEGMVSRLPDIDYEEIEPLVRDIAAAVEEIKGKAGNKRALSWRE